MNGCNPNFKWTCGNFLISLHHLAPAPFQSPFKSLHHAFPIHGRNRSNVVKHEPSWRNSKLRPFGVGYRVILFAGHGGICLSKQNSQFRCKCFWFYSSSFFPSFSPSVLVGLFGSFFNLKKCLSYSEYLLVYRYICKNMYTYYITSHQTVLNSICTIQSNIWYIIVHADITFYHTIL